MPQTLNSLIKQKFINYTKYETGGFSVDSRMMLLQIIFLVFGLHLRSYFKHKVDFCIEISVSRITLH